MQRQMNDTWRKQRAMNSHQRTERRRAQAVLLAGLAAVAGGSLPARTETAPGACPAPPISRAYVQRVDRALRAGKDVWGNELLAAPGGPTYEGVRRYVTPVLFAGAPGMTSATESGVHYVPFGLPDDTGGAQAVALHVADGSQLLSNRIDGPSLTIGVGARGGERYGACLSRLRASRLADGWLPILDTAYTDARGVSYRQESFVARLPQTGRLASFLEIDAGAGEATAPAELKLIPSVGSALAFAIGAGSTRQVFVARAIAAPSRPIAVDRATFDAARRSVVEYWTHRLSEGAGIDVPERRVMDARRNLLVQNLTLTWRYSIGNAYEEFSFPEGVDVAEVMSAQGFGSVARAILATSLTQPLQPYANWKMGQKLVGSALYYQLFRDRSYVDEVTPVLDDYVESLGRQIAASPRGILERERYSSDIADSVYGLHSQAVVWQGIRSMGSVWAQTGRPDLAARCRSLAARLEAGLRRAVRESERRLSDGSLFIPVRLLDDEAPYDALTTTRAGSYWNLVAPYALASGFFAPNGPEATGALRYMLLHGSRLLGLVRAGAYALYGHSPRYPESGTDQVYGLNVARFLADNDRPDQLVLSLYGQLGAAMTQGTFVSGEAASIAPVAGRYQRSTYLPPNGASNGTFLETLRLMLVHETRDPSGEPRGLELAFATPRAWLAPGKRIAVQRLPTGFGPLSYSVESSGRTVRVSIDVPRRAPLNSLRLRLRLPSGDRVVDMTVDGRRTAPSATVGLPTRPGHLEVVAQVVRSARP